MRRRPAAPGAAASSQKKGRRLWGNAHGDFQTAGHDASATVTGTKWLVQDSCSGTLVKVARGVVRVDDFIHHRTATVTAGHSYLAATGRGGQHSSAGAVSHSLLWRALDGKVICGVEAHPTNALAVAMLCMSRSVPPPPHTTNEEGDSGFVFLRGTGSPRPTRVSQYVFQPENGWLPKNQAAFGAGQKWSYPAIGVTCVVAATKVRCTNHSGDGFTLTKSCYKGF